jgi:hypothetical protein
MMTFQRVLQAFVENRRTLLLHLPGEGWTLATIHALDDDMVTVQPAGQSLTLVMHYTQVVLQRETPGAGAPRA